VPTEVALNRRRTSDEPSSTINKKRSRRRGKENVLKYDNGSKPEATTSHPSLKLTVVVAKESSFIVAIQENKVGLSW
jgi:hypothetical protein